MKRIARLSLLLAVTALPAIAAPASGPDTTPTLIKPNLPEDPRIAQQKKETLEKVKSALDKLKDVQLPKINSPVDAGKLEDLGVKSPKAVEAMQAALNLMQEYGLIDPAEKYAQPDLNPPGQPKLASCAAKNPNLSTDQQVEYVSIKKSIDRARNFLENNYVVLRKTETHAKRLTDLADSAASISGFAGLAWATAQANPSDPMNKAKASFYDKYDGAQVNGLNYLNDALKKLSELEHTTCGDSNWYLYYGLPYYNFMVARYTRPGAGAAP